MTPSLFDPRVRTARRLGLEAGQRSADANPGFTEAALQFVRWYAETNVEFSGEDCTLAAKARGIRPADDRAFGPVYAKALRDGIIKRVGYCSRARGHGTFGGSVYSKG